MEWFDLKLVLIVTFAIVAIVAIVRYRGRFGATLKGLGFEFGITAENGDEPSSKREEKTSNEPAKTSEGGNIAEASGDSAVAIGGSADGAHISTSTSGPKRESKL